MTSMQALTLAHMSDADTLREKTHKGACTCRHTNTDKTLIYMVLKNYKNGGKRTKENNEAAKKKVPGELSSLNKCEIIPKRMAHLAKAVPTPLRKKKKKTMMLLPQ